MRELPRWTYAGDRSQDDLSQLESQLHAGRVAAAERGYDAPDSIDVSEVMLGGDRIISAEAASVAGLNFVPTHARFMMAWNAHT
jgi:hypothetical protein